MAKATVTTANLETLGVRRLAELLMELAEDDAATKRRLRLELAATKAPETVAAEVRKRLGQIGRATGFVDWRKVRDLAADLDLQRRTIAEQVAKVDAAEALELTWRLLGLAESVYERCDDSGGAVGDVFRTRATISARSPRPQLRTTSHWPIACSPRSTTTTTASTTV